ncbi:hypothetical protein XELAEV_18012292mg [Xenopus laevis]|uniref:Uncharacterized protein n=1 Tax=Xenopus laevis TaxID=8355 RepID=A0A974HY88_XENLA|nr:hypothetical protein XELAEV_18012292mg [Xenopus laevis]
MWDGHLLFIYKHNPGGPSLTVPTRYMNTNGGRFCFYLTTLSLTLVAIDFLSGHTYILGHNGYGHLSLIFSKTSLMS